MFFISIGNNREGYFPCNNRKYDPHLNTIYYDSISILVYKRPVASFIIIVVLFYILQIKYVYMCNRQGERDYSTSFGTEAQVDENCSNGGQQKTASNFTES